ncbi:NAD(P)/FAD-dependent oxidoreductase [Pelagibacterium halotolerans]|uniref:FAD dependent oxidoreductase n=1 Tax=Pelagibacterium halotolerans (strain DSM 22347 / JCM 15775 / CGMCC 1.7692 / B2) TaxID=1082931 RepID=G4RD33_PELHB|nr:FAD-binding oxidoreductase [Pelagibacterium halotolerans]AEQ53783.1 FAD dependent oxidoreductase [Pelagibacterium halotolerans B2]QJR20058.1 FAD-binding oxidoreductase [Pelagibacterium halotolerans]SEA80929.1 Glycine/D-amino acid oxidase [Pelagibacterium halotolerans]
MKDSYDVVIVGGAVIGSAVAYYLTANTDFTGSVLVVEKDPSYVKASTSLSSSSIRTQFSNPINVRISQYGSEVIRNFARMMEVDGDRPDLHFHSGGYLFLANTPDQVQTLRENHEVQKACGADVVLWNRDELADAFPHLRVDDIELASYGRSGEGWFNNTGMMYGFKAKARAQGAEFVTDEVTAIGRDGNRVTSVTLKSGQIVTAGTLVNASGPRAALTARMAGLDIPVEPRKRTLFVFDCADTPEGSAQVNDGRLPLMIDPSGVFCRPEGKFFLSGCPPIEDPAVDWDDFEPRYDEFEEVIWPTLAERSQQFEAIKVVNQWAGHYAFNTLDHNMVVGRHPEVKNFIFANGFSGHGLQQGPATGRGVSELITYGQYRELDLSEVGFERIVENRPFLEKAVI